jgi:hypothetical protein
MNKKKNKETIINKGKEIKKKHKRMKLSAKE